VSEISAVPVVASFSALALVFAVFYFLASGLGANLASLIKRARHKGSAIPFEPGRFIQQEVHDLGGRLRRHGTAALIFCTSLASLLAIGRQGWWPELPVWAWLILLVTILGIIGYTEIRCIGLAICRRKLKLLRDDHVVIADHLNEARSRGNRIFHSIPMREGVIDHVIVGKKGIFAIQIVRPPSRKFTSVRLEYDMLVFAPRNVEKGIKNIRKFTRPVTMLSERLTNALQHTVNVRPMIIVTDCQVESSTNPSCLLVNAASCNMFVGWNDPEAYLMDDEIEKISDWLVHRCREMPFRRWNADFYSGGLNRV